MPKEHNNYLQLSLTGIKIKSFDVTDYSITDGQPYGGVTVFTDDKICIQAGRKGSSTVADWFKKKANTGVVIACDTGESYPSSLNFAIYGTLTFESAGSTFVVKDILLAQGRNSRQRNNWWVGGPNMEGGSVKPFAGAVSTTAHKPKFLSLPIAKVWFIAPPLCVSHFDLAFVSLV